MVQADTHSSESSRIESWNSVGDPPASPSLSSSRATRATFLHELSVLEFSRRRARVRVDRSVELRALCNEVPRTPPGPEGSNGTGYASGAADHPKFLSPKEVFIRKF